MKKTYIDLLSVSKPDYIIRCYSINDKKVLSEMIAARSKAFLTTNNGDKLLLTRLVYENFMFIILDDDNVDLGEKQITN